MEKQTDEATKALHEALVEVQAALTPAALDGTNPHLHNQYATLTSVWESTGLRALLKSVGLAVIQTPFGKSMGGEAWIGVNTLILHEGGGQLEGNFAIPLGEAGRGRSLAQEAGSIVTYLRRYSLAAMFGIVDEKDNDGGKPPRRNGQGGTGKRAAKKAPPAPPQSPPTGPTTEQKEYWDGLSSVEKQAYKSWQGLMGAVAGLDRYDNAFAASGAIGKLFPALKESDAQPTAKSYEHGVTRVNIYRTVKAYAELRDSGMDGDIAQSTAFATAKNL